MFDNLKNSSLSEVPKKKLFSIGKLERGRRDEGWRFPWRRGNNEVNLRRVLDISVFTYVDASDVSLQPV